MLTALWPKKLEYLLRFLLAKTFSLNSYKALTFCLCLLQSILESRVKTDSTLAKELDNGYFLRWSWITRMYDTQDCLLGGTEEEAPSLV